MEIFSLGAPSRINFEGGGTDANPFISQYGGLVLNVTIINITYINVFSDLKVAVKSVYKYFFSPSKNLNVVKLNTDSIFIRESKRVWKVFASFLTELKSWNNFRTTNMIITVFGKTRQLSHKNGDLVWIHKHH